MCPHTPPEISIIIVSYNVREELGRCLDALAPVRRRERVEVCVVDNASEDGSGDFVGVQYPWVVLIRNPRNAGFAAAVNQGFARTHGAYILLLNPDAVVDPGAIERLHTFLRTHPECGIVGGQLLNPDGSLQHSWHTFPTPLSLIAESLFLARLFDPPRRAAVPFEVDAVVGACLMLRREVQQIGDFDERFFLYSEETDGCRRARDHGWKVYFLPDVRVFHGLGRSADVNPGAAFVELYRSRDVYMRKYFTPASRRLTHAGLFIGVVLRAILWGTAWAITSFRRNRPPAVVRKFAQNKAVLGWYLAGCPVAREAMDGARPV